jgi:hypothetical protein
MPSSSTAPEGPGSISGAPNLPSDLREGYAEIGDQRLHYVEAGEGPLVAGELLRTENSAVAFFNAKIERYPNHLGRTVLWAGASVCSTACANTPDRTSPR